MNLQQAELLVGLYQAGEFVRDLLATQLPLGTRELLLSHDAIDDKGQLTGLGVALARHLAFAANRGPDPHLVATAEEMEAALDDGWDVVAPGSSRSSAHTDTQAEAINRAREIVTNLGGGEVVIHRPDGTIRDSDTVGGGNDPHPPPTGSSPRAPKNGLAAWPGVDRWSDVHDRDEFDAEGLLLRR